MRWTQRRSRAVAEVHEREEALLDLRDVKSRKVQSARSRSRLPTGIIYSCHLHMTNEGHLEDST
jgi:hypothetical protein